MASARSSERDAARLLLIEASRCDGIARRLDLLEAGVELLAGVHGAEGVTADLEELRRSYTALTLTLPTGDRDVREGAVDRMKSLLLRLSPQGLSGWEVARRPLRPLVRPADGGVVGVTPPGFSWAPAPGATGYRIEVCDERGEAVWGTRLARVPCVLPERALPPGSYTWSVHAVDFRGAESPVLRRRFHVEPGTPELPWQTPEDILARIDTAHPRLLYPRASLATLRASAATSRRRVVASCIAAADKCLALTLPEPPPRAWFDDPQNRVAAYRRSMELRVLLESGLTNLCLAYLVTREERYAEPAKRLLLDVARWPTDDADVTSVSSRGGDEIGLALARTLPRAYDWLHAALSAGERAEVRGACSERAWQAHRRLVRHECVAYPGESHNSRLVSHMLEMAIALHGEVEGPATWLEYGLRLLTTSIPQWADSQGGWAEGPAYGAWHYPYFVAAAEALRIATGFDLWKRPELRRFPYFLAYATSLRARVAPFGDGAENEGPGRPEGSAYGSLMRHFAHRLEDPVLGWFAAQSTPEEDGNRECALLHEDELPTHAPSELPQSRCFEGVGVAALHSDLADPDRDTTVLFRSSPIGSPSKSHADQNAFCIFKGGRPLAIASGYDGPSSGMPHHFDWTHTTRANNSVLVDGRGQEIQSRDATGRITRFLERPGHSYVLGDAAPAYAGRLRRFARHLLFLRPGVVLLLDELEAPGAARFQWMLHALERLDVDVPSAVVTSRHRGSSLEIALASGAGLSFSQTDRFDPPYNTGVPPEQWVEVARQWHLTAETEDRTEATRIGAAMAVWDEAEPFEIERPTHPGWTGIRAHGDDGAVEGWVQLEAGAPGPEGFGEAVRAGRSPICGRDAQGAHFEAAESTAPFGCSGRRS